MFLIGLERFYILSCECRSSPHFELLYWSLLPTTVRLRFGDAFGRIR